MKRTLLSIALLVACTSVSAESWTYRGTLNDGGKPANGSYDLQVTLLNEAKSATISGPVTFYSVKVVEGSFAVDVDFGIDLANAPVMSLKTEVQQGSSGYVALGEPTRFDPKAALAGVCWDTEGNTGILPATNFIGTTESQTVVLKSGRGVSINLQGNIPSTPPPIGMGQVDMQIGSVGGTGDATVELVAGSSGRARISKNNVSNDLEISAGTLINSPGVIQFLDRRPLADKNAIPMAVFGNRIRAGAAGADPLDVGGGMWMDDENAYASYIGRGRNQENWTGIYSGSAWTAISTDDGAFLINRTLPLLNTGDDLVIGARPVGGDADSDLVWATRTNKAGRIYLSDTNGGFVWGASNLGATTPFLTVSNGASLSHGGTWTNASSRSLKTGFAAINPLEMLSKVVALPITSWVYKSSLEGTHVGPIAEDFKAAFGLAGDGKSISTVDADGVALAAIQGLNLKLEAENAALKVRLDALEAKLK